MSEKKQIKVWQSFMGGIVVGFLVLSTVGFFILLGMVMKGGDEVKTSGGEKIAVDNVGTPEVNPAIMVTPVDENVDHIRGNKNSEIALIEYSDLECPYCKYFHETTLQIYKKYGDKIKIVFRHFPLDSLHQQARAEANATECAGEQGKFWEMLDLIFEKTKSNDGFDLDMLPDYATQIGLNVNKFNTCVVENKYADKVEADAQSAIAAGGQGTPYSVILGPNGEIIPISGAQSYENVSAAIESLL